MANSLTLHFAYQHCNMRIARFKAIETVVNVDVNPTVLS